MVYFSLLSNSVLSRLNYRCVPCHQAMAACKPLPVRRMALHSVQEPFGNGAKPLPRLVKDVQQPVASRQTQYSKQATRSPRKAHKAPFVLKHAEMAGNKHNINNAPSGSTPGRQPLKMVAPGRSCRDAELYEPAWSRPSLQPHTTPSFSTGHPTPRGATLHGNNTTWDASNDTASMGQQSSPVDQDIVGGSDCAPCVIQAASASTLVAGVDMAPCGAFKGISKLNSSPTVEDLIVIAPGGACS